MGAVDERLLRRSRAVRAHVVLAVGLGTVTAAALVAQAWTLSTIIARGTEGVLLDAVDGSLLLLAIAIVVRAASVWGHQVVAARTAAKVKTELRDDLMAALLGPREAPAAPAALRGASAATLVGSGLDDLDAWFSRYLPQLVLCAIVPATVALTVLSVDLPAGLTIALTVPLVLVFMVLVGLTTADLMRRRWRATERLGRHFADLLAGLPTLVALNRADRQVGGLRRTGEEHRAATMGGLRLAFLSALVLELVATLSVAMVAVGVGLRLLDGGLGLQSGLFVLLLAPEAYLPLRQLGMHYHDSAAGVAALDDAFGLLEEGHHHHQMPPTPEASTRPGPLSPRQLVLEAEDVSVAYPQRGGSGLAPTTLMVERGEVVGVSGPSGCGKSTLLAVLLGLVRPTSGSVRLLGARLDETDLARWHRRVAWVPQAPTIVSGTVADNVGLGLVDVPGTAVREALVAAGAGDLRPERIVGERSAPAGTALSAGEQRRLGLARALLRVQLGRVDVMLLDEPTASLDGDTETWVTERIRSAGITSVVVAHRPRMLAAVDRTVVLSTPSTAATAVA